MTTFCSNMPCADKESIPKSQQHNVLQFCRWAKQPSSFLAAKHRHSHSVFSILSWASMQDFPSLQSFLRGHLTLFNRPLIRWMQMQGESGVRFLIWLRAMSGIFGAGKNRQREPKLLLLPIGINWTLGTVLPDLFCAWKPKSRAAWAKKWAV